jgi:TIR domain
MTNLAELRIHVTEDQRAILNTIWRHYIEAEDQNDSWIRAGILYHRLGKGQTEETVHAALQSLGGAVVYETPNYGNGRRYTLTFLGMLLAEQGREIEIVLAKALARIRDLFLESSHGRLNVRKVAEDIELTESQSNLLFRVFAWAGFLSGGGSIEDAGWPLDIDDLVPIDDFKAYIQERQLQKFDPSVPVDSDPLIRQYGAVAIERDRPQKLGYQPWSSELTADHLELGGEKMKYDVAISFAGEQREEARAIAECLKGAGIEVFFDEYNDADLWGKDLYEHLSDVYQNQAQYCVILVSRAYADKVWTTHERRSAQARALREKREYILPVRFDDTELPGLLPTVGYLDFTRYGAAGICQTFLRKISRSDPAIGISAKLKVTTSSLALIQECESKVVGFIPVVKSGWGSSRVQLTLEPDDLTDGPFLDSLKMRNRIYVAYGNHLALCKVLDNTHSKAVGVSQWELTLHPENSEFDPSIEMGTSTTSKDEYAQKRARRLLLNEKAAGDLNDINQMMDEMFLRGQWATFPVDGSPFPQLFRQYGNDPKKFLEIAWVLSAFLLRASATVAEILHLELTLNGKTLEIDFWGRRKKEYMNRPAYEMKVQGICSLS